MIDKGHTCWKKMGVLNFIISSLLITVISAREFVPVLLWGTQSLSNTHQTVPGLSRLSTDEFLDYLLKKVKVEKPVIVVFMEENISVEDFSWRDVDENGAFPLTSNITKLASDVSFLPSVLNPYRSLKKLREHGYSWEIYNDDVDTTLQDDEAVILLVKLQEPKYLEDRPDMLRNHDQHIAKVYSKLLKWKSNVLAIYTGHHCSWIDAEVEYNRVKREDNPGDKPEKPAPVVIYDANKTVILAFMPPLVYAIGDEVYNITEVSSTPTINKNETYINFDVNFKGPGGKLEIDFHISGREDGNWVLSKATLNENKEDVLLPKVSIGAPRGWSWFCQEETMFATAPGTDEKKIANLTFYELQIQPYVKGGNFSAPIDCVPYFSSAIWSGIFVVFILSLVMAWGIIMIMDINTMDRFDDPKGKTITITATD